MAKRHLGYAEIAKRMAQTGYGWPDCEKSPIDIFNDPPGTDRTTRRECQQTILLMGILEAVYDLTKATASVRRAVDRVPDKIETARLSAQLKLAKQETKAAEARERAAKAELNAKLAEPPIIYSCDEDEMKALQVNGRIKQWF